SAIATPQRIEQQESRNDLQTNRGRQPQTRAPAPTIGQRGERPGDAQDNDEINLPTCQSIAYLNETDYDGYDAIEPPSPAARRHGAHCWIIGTGFQRL